MSYEAAIIAAIDTSPLNRGLSGAAWLAHEGNIPIVMGDDIALFDDASDGIYEIHLLYKSRGRAAIQATREAFAAIFGRGANMIYAMVPDFRRDVKLLARWMKMRFCGLRQTEYGPCELFVLTNEMWKEGLGR